jgi:CubicO group peptidase (beta-lactamase class C family)
MKVTKYAPILFVLIAILFLEACQPAASGPNMDFSLPPVPKQPSRTVMEIGVISSQVNDSLQALYEESGVPSFTVGIVIEDEMVWSKSYGGHAGTDTVYEVGSVTKPFVATAVLQLYEKGLIDLDVDVNNYLPFTLRHPKYPDESISVRMLLTHQAGFAQDNENLRRFQNPSNALYKYVKNGFGLDIAVLNLQPQPTRSVFFPELLVPGGIYYTKDVWSHEPGTYQYSNVGYSTIAYLIEIVTGEPVEDYLEKNLFGPLEMDLSGIDLAKLTPYHALPYQRIQGEYVFLPFQDIPVLKLCKSTQFGCIVKNLTNPGGYLPTPESIKAYLEDGYLRFPVLKGMIDSGGLRSTVPDLAKFMIAHMNQGVAPNGYAILQPETVEMMHAKVASQDGSINMIPLTGYGMGWTLAEDGIQGHIGGAFGSEAEMLYQDTPQGKYGIIFLRNWSWELADDYQNGFEYWKKYHVGVREILMDEAMGMLD